MIGLFVAPLGLFGEVDPFYRDMKVLILDEAVRRGTAGPFVKQLALINEMLGRDIKVIPDLSGTTQQRDRNGVPVLLYSVSYWARIVEALSL